MKRVTLFLFLWALSFGSNALSKPSVVGNGRWSVAILFLGGDEDAGYQSDVDANLEELSRISMGSGLSVHVYREAKNENLLSNPAKLGAILAESYASPASRRLLMVYQHGLGPEGLRGTSLPQLRAIFEKALPRRAGTKPLDILWLDSCFMGNIEAAYELKDLSQFYVGSEGAEFTAGAPYQEIEELKSAKTIPEAAAVSLARGFIESYSYVKDGSQRTAVSTSPATITVVETSKLTAIAKELKSLKSALGELPGPVREKLRRNAQARSLESETLSDLGHFLISLRTVEIPDQASRIVDQTLDTLGIAKTTRTLRSNVRITLRPPTDDSVLVWGYEGWMRSLPVEPEVAGLRPALAFSWNGRSYPARGVHKRIVVEPFAPGLNEFDYFFADASTKQPLTQPESVVRTLDAAERVRRVSTSPIAYTAYTQSLGAVAERYTGLSILEPFRGGESLEYMETRFARDTGWGAL